MQTENFDPEHIDRLDHIKELDKKERNIWLQKEKNFWEEILKTLRIKSSIIYEINLVESYLRTIDVTLLDSTDINKFEQFHNVQPLPLHDEHPHAEHIVEFANNSQFHTGQYLFQSLLQQQGTLYIGKYKTVLKKLERGVVSTINSEHEKYINHISESRKAFNVFAETATNEFQENLKERLEAATTEISNTVTVATNAILSAEPVKYWEEREKTHRTKARNYRQGVIISAVFFIFTLVFLTLSVYKNGEPYNIYGIPLTLPAEKFSIALLIISTTAAIWLVRILVKLMMTNLALEIEALERSTMIKTYIAMDSTKVEQAAEIRMLFYTTLFRPYSYSLTDDSTSPEYIRIIEAMLQKKT